MRALVVGGTGPTGPHIVAGLVSRGYDVTVFHRGFHELPELADVEHIHGDPHFRESIDESLGSRRFDVVAAMYGRVKLLAAALAGRCEQFVSIGGVPVYRGFFPTPQDPQLPIPVTEAHPVVQDATDDPALRFCRRLVETEEAVFANHPRASVFRFPMIYGPNNPRPIEWSVVRRVRDGRPHMILPDGGMQIFTRCAARNAAAMVLAAFDRPEAAGGQVYNCGDPVNWSMRQWAETIAHLMGARLEIIPIPSQIAVEAASTLLPLANTTSTHCIFSTEKAQHQLGYRPVIEPTDALAEVVAWYESDRTFDPSSNPAFTDRFDYRTEDAVIREYQAAVERFHHTVEQHAQPPIHSMPHPTEPGRRDHHGR